MMLLQSILQLATRVVRTSVRRFSSTPSSVPLTADQYSVKRGDYSKVTCMCRCAFKHLHYSDIIRLVSWI